MKKKLVCGLTLAMALGFSGCGGGGGTDSVATTSTQTQVAVTNPAIQPSAPPPITAPNPAAPAPAATPPQTIVTPPQPIQFRDVTDIAGITTLHERPSEYFITGQAWGDYNNDGRLDLYLTRTNGLNDLYLNRGDGSFEISPLSSQVALPADVSGGAVFVDYDNDGWKDLYVLNNGPNVLFKNNGGTSFTDVTATAGLSHPGMGETATWGDYDEDGHLDVYIVNWGDESTPDDGFYHNNGDGTFTDVTHFLNPLMVTGLGFTASFCDYDNDGDLDIYLVNDKGIPGPDTPPLLRRNALFRNDGAGGPGWVFTEVAVPAGADARVQGMGLAVGDYDKDGNLDFAFSDAGPPFLLDNQGNGTFDDVSQAAGIRNGGVGWGTIFTDFDRDGWLDLYIAVSTEGNHVFRNNGDGTFEDVSVLSRGSDPNTGMGLAYGDYDGDGRVDLALGNQSSGYRLLRNEGAPDNRWLTVRVEGGGGVNRDGVGTRVTVVRTDGQTQMQEVKCGSSLGSGNDLALNYGIGDSEIAEVRVLWPDGLSQTFTGIAFNQEINFQHP